MTSGVPVAASVELYNQLLSLPFSDREGIGRIEFRLRQLRRQMASDPRIAVATLQALLMAGKPGDALELADWIWDQRARLTPDVERTFGSQLMDLASYDRARSILEPKLAATDDALSSDLYPLIRYLAFGQGDLALLERVASVIGRSAVEHDRQAAEALAGFAAVVRDIGLERHFARHQGIVADILRGHQCTVHFLLVARERGPELIVYSYVAAGRAERRVLEARIDEALARYYEARGLPSAVHVPVITTNVIDLAACHAPKGPE